jgi:hypothetical protein
MNAGYAVRDIHDQEYQGKMVATLATPFGPIRVSYDTLYVSDGVTHFVRAGQKEGVVTNVDVVAVAAPGMPYFAVAASLMYAVSQDDLFEEQLDAMAKARIYKQRAERLYGQNTDTSEDSRPPFD